MNCILDSEIIEDYASEAGLRGDSSRKNLVEDESEAYHTSLYIVHHLVNPCMPAGSKLLETQPDTRHGTNQQRMFRCKTDLLSSCRLRIESDKEEIRRRS